jgi:hypothetical protein
MRARTIIPLLLALGVAAAALGAGTAAFGAGGPTVCRAAQWCTITASGDSVPNATQFAIGNVRRGTVMAITNWDVKHRQVGGEILTGELYGLCAWSQYQRDWAPVAVVDPPSCAQPLHLTSEYVATTSGGAAAIWTGCYPRCFGGVPLRYDRRCGTRGRTFCYSRNCTEYANFSPWSPGAHPSDALRRTQRHRLDIRYRARYGDVWNGHPFYMVRDGNVGHGRGNWVFISGVECAVVAGPIGTYHHAPHHQ